MIDDLFVPDVDLTLFDEGRDGYDDGKFFWIPLEVVCHGDDGLIFMPCQNDSRGLVEDFGIGLCYVEAAEAMGELRGER